VSTSTENIAALGRDLLQRGGLPRDLLIGGAWRESSDGRRFAVDDPATEITLTTVADGTADDALAALDAAASVQAEWGATTPQVRADILHAAFRGIMRRADELAVLISLEMGKPITEARGEVTYGAAYLRWYAEEAVRSYGRDSVSPDGLSRIATRHEPVGPCLLITPWNYPLAMGLRKIAPALAAGCSVVLKPAELTPLTSLLATEILTQAGVPPGVCNVVTTTRPAALSEALLADPRLRKLSFTGSTKVGRHLLSRSGEQVLRTSMELGGDAPLLVFDDADLERAVEGAVTAKRRNSGQSCVAANRILVQDGIAEAFIDRFTAALARTKMGPGLDPTTTLGPLISRTAVAKAQRLVDDAVARGARVLIGQSAVDTDGYFFPPTVLDAVPRDAHILREEVFGPVAPITRFSSEWEAIHQANDTEFGLAAYLFTENLDRAARISSGLQAGMVAINQGLVSNVAAPFGGIRHSGLGREGGPEGLQEYTSIKYLAYATPEQP
jgi:succinate-semialdehyde dehydrogenase / glutarate-semialdehyde dehydrogenase